MDSSFDWESEVLELRQCAINPERADFEQKLWNSWETARDNMDKNAKLIMHDEALKVQSPSDSYLTLLQKDNRDDSVAQANRSGRAHEMSPSLWALGLGTAGWFGSQVKNALAAEESVSAAITEAASKTAPGWVAPSVLAFPVVSYALFTLYRQKVLCFPPPHDELNRILKPIRKINVIRMCEIAEFCFYFISLCLFAED